MKTSTRERRIIGVHKGVTVLNTRDQEAVRRRENSHLRINPGIIRTNPVTMMEIGETSTSSENTGQSVTAKHHRAAKLSRKLPNNNDTHYNN